MPIRRQGVSFHRSLGWLKIYYALQQCSGPFVRTTHRWYWSLVASWHNDQGMRKGFFIKPDLIMVNFGASQRQHMYLQHLFEHPGVDGSRVPNRCSLALVIRLHRCTSGMKFTPFLLKSSSILCRQHFEINFRDIELYFPNSSIHYQNGVSSNKR